MLLRRSSPSPAGSTPARRESTTISGPNRNSLAFTRIVAAGALALASLLTGVLIAPTAAFAAPQTAEVAPSTSARLPSGAVPSGAIPALPLVTTIPVVTGAHAVGQGLTVTALWLPAPVTFYYQWKRDGKSISGATGSTYKVLRKDAGHVITATVKGTKTGFVTAVRTSAGARIQKVLTATPIPTITGIASEGRLLWAHSASWSPSPVKVTYSWRVNGVVVGTGSTYKIKAADAGQWITVWSTGTKSGYTSVTRMSLFKLVLGGVVSS